MSRGLYVVGTGTDIGKTYVTALLIKLLRRAGYQVGYYKPVISGAPSVALSDAGYVNAAAAIKEREDLLLSYRYNHAVSPHLAARWEERPVEKEYILKAWQRVCEQYPYVTVEGSGGIVCPLRCDNQAEYYLENIIQWFDIPSVIVGDAGLGAINAAALTAFYMQGKKLPVQGVILNHYTGSLMEKDNIRMIEKITDKPVVAVVREGDTVLDGDVDQLISFYGKGKKL